MVYVKRGADVTAISIYIGGLRLRLNYAVYILPNVYVALFYLHFDFLAIVPSYSKSSALAFFTDFVIIGV